MRGFSLTEIIIYLSIFALFSVSLVSYTLLLSQINQKRIVMAEILYAGERISDYIQSQIDKSTGIASPEFRASSDQLTISQDLSSIEIVCENNQLLVRSGLDEYSLHSHQVKCRNLQFVNISDQSPALSFSVELYSEGDSREYVYDLSFSTSFIRV